MNRYPLFLPHVQHIFHEIKDHTSLRLRLFVEQIVLLDHVFQHRFPLLRDRKPRLVAILIASCPLAKFDLELA